MQHLTKCNMQLCKKCKPNNVCITICVLLTNSAQNKLNNNQSMFYRNFWEFWNNLKCLVIAFMYCVVASQFVSYHYDCNFVATFKCPPPPPLFIMGKYKIERIILVFFLNKISSPKAEFYE